MSREIKFRAWDKEDKKMWKVVSITESIYGDCEESHIRICEFDKMPTDKATNVRISYDYELMQYTGLKDKNGKEIYEGDILRYLDSYDCSTESGYDFEEFLNVGQVIFNDEKGRFDITNKSDISYDDWIESVSDCEIIGNIYENPELLEATA